MHNLNFSELVPIVYGISTLADWRIGWSHHSAHAVADVEGVDCMRLKALRQLYTAAFLLAFPHSDNRQVAIKAIIVVSS